MKYMTFNSSCSYAGIANMLELNGIDTSDRDIALAMKLPYLFDYSGGVYLSGPMLQSAEWFDLYLNPIGYRLRETLVHADELIDYLKLQKTAMLGIKFEDAGKHAVVYIGMESDLFIFLNNKWEKENSVSEIRLTEADLKKRIELEVMVATLQKISPREIDFTEKLKSSENVLHANLADIIELSNRQESVADLRMKLNKLFRPLFLDGITMLNMIGETSLAQSFTQLQQELLSALKNNPSDCIFLKDYISLSNLQKSVRVYIELIEHELLSRKDR